MTPEVLELIENAAHLFGHGDTAHAADHETGDDSDEHGCTGASHACACHTSQPFADSTIVVSLETPLRRNDAVVFSAKSLADSGFVAGIDRPPQV